MNLKGMHKSVKNMRVFHNNVKKCLISFARQGRQDYKLFDIGVGRGGDMFKWSKNKIMHVIGYDVDDLSIQEAKRRFLNSNFSDDHHYDFYTFPNIHLAVDTLNIGPNQFDIVSCQFAIHYFFKNEQLITNLIETVSKILKPNGKFIGTFMDADELSVLTNNFTSMFHNSTCLIHPRSVIDPKTPYGNCMQVHLTNTLYFGECSISIEYLVYKHHLKEICKQYGLTLIEFKPFRNYYHEHYTNMYMDEDTMKCSFTYTSFVFEKDS